MRQTEVELLDLSVLETRALRAPEEYADKLLDTWGQLQLFGLGIGDLLRRLDQTFQYKEVINKSELEDILRECNLDRSFMNKLRPFIRFRDDSVEKTDRFDKLLQAYTEKWPNVDNTSRLWREDSQRGINYEIDLLTYKVIKVESHERFGG